MCLYPKLIRNPKYTATKKNGGNIPPVHDWRITVVPIGCKECIECRKQKAREWQTRMLEDIKQHKNGKFVTLTLSDQSIAELSKEIKHSKGYDLDNDIATLATRRFLERWRKKHKKSIRHWLITELGHNGTENIHLHGIIWTDHTMAEIENTWKYGHMWKGSYVNEKTVNYIIKYVTKIDLIHKNYKSIILTSAGIGGIYTQRKIGDWQRNKYKPGETRETYKTNTGANIAMPTYWRNKIYTEEEREKLWIEKLDKQERWILGKKIDISQGDEIYNKALKTAQEKNKRLGYGNGETNWEQATYEQERRILKQKIRIAKGTKSKTLAAGQLNTNTD